MKKTLLAAALLLALALPSFAASNENAAIAQAKSDPGVQACIQNARQSGLEINAAATVLATCENGGSSWTVDFWAAPNCPPNKICPMYLVLAASAEVACDNTVTQTWCGAATR